MVTKKLRKVVSRLMVIAGCTIFLGLNKATAQTIKSEIMSKKILFVVTSHDKLGDTGKETGYYMGEVTHPWAVLVDAGYEVDFVSPKGGNPPYYGLNNEDLVDQRFLADEKYQAKIQNSLKPSEVNPEDYSVIMYAGGHGTMWDFPNNTELANIAQKIYENNGIVSAVCHGPAGLVNIKLSNGNYLVDGKKINAFTNEEEKAVELDNVVPFSLESTLIERGANFEKSGLWETHVTVDQRVITGQNPQSAHKVGEAILAELKKIN